jgi:hypothetical protein
MRMLAAIVVATGLTTLGSGSADAQLNSFDRWFWHYNNLPWCTQTSSMPECDYATLEQCLAARSGVGGSCSPNPRLSYQPDDMPPPDQPPPRRARRYR